MTTKVKKFGEQRQENEKEEKFKNKRNLACARKN